MNGELTQLREDIAMLRERIAVLESKLEVKPTHVFVPMAPAPVWVNPTWQIPNQITCGTCQVGALLP